MLSKLELFTEICQNLDERGIVLHEKRCLCKRHLHSSCKRCSAVCPNGAIASVEGLEFMAEKCTGCGACTAVCPSGALSAKLPSDKELQSLVALHVKHSGAVAFACESYLKEHPTERCRTIAVQCIARCNEAILAGTVLQGAASVSILSATCSECPQHNVCDFVQTMVDTANRLMKCWKYPVVIALTQNIPGSIRPLPTTESKAIGGMSRRAFFTAFKKKSESLITEVLPEIILGTADKSQENIQNPLEEPKYLPEKWCLLVSSLKQLPSLKTSLGFQSSLWGDIKIADSCNGCGACTDACPTSAIVMLQKDGRWNISLDALRCTQCGLCKDVCCFESIEIISTVALDTMLAGTLRVLIEKGQEETDNLLESVSQRMARLLGCAVKD